MQLRGRSGPVVVGHRGAPRVERENTPAAFAAAAAAGATWVELDVRRTADGVLVVHHDPAVDGLVLVEATADEAQRLGVATFAQVMASLPLGLGVDVEVKNMPGEPDYDDTDAIADLVARTLPGLLGDRPVMTSSFNPSVVAVLAATLPAVPAGLLYGPFLAPAAALEIAREVGARVLCPHVDAPSLDAAAVSAVHDAGMPVLVWTVDDPARARELAAAGVDALCTNDPAGIVAALRIA